MDKQPVFAPKTYKVVRGFRDSYRRYTIARGLTLEEAQAHCRDPETSSSTCHTAAGKRRTKRFDGYEEERNR